MDIKEYIASGILEQYVLGTISAEELLVVEQMAANHLEIKEEILSISYVLEKLAIENAIAPDATEGKYVVQLPGPLKMIFCGSSQLIISLVAPIYRFVDNAGRFVGIIDNDLSADAFTVPLTSTA